MNIFSACTRSHFASLLRRKRAKDCLWLAGFLCLFVCLFVSWEKSYLEQFCLDLCDMWVTHSNNYIMIIMIIMIMIMSIVIIIMWMYVTCGSLTHTATTAAVSLSSRVLQSSTNHPFLSILVLQFSTFSDCSVMCILQFSNWWKYQQTCKAQKQFILF